MPSTHDPHRNIIQQMCKTLKCEASLPYAHQPLIWDEVKTVVALGDQPTYCVEVPGTETYLSTNVSFNSGKTALSAMVETWYAHVMSEPYGEVYVVANSKEHGKGRAFMEILKFHTLDKRLAARTEQVSPGLGVIKLKNGTIIQVLASNYATVAGANPELSTFDELWCSVSEQDRLLWDELANSPSRRNSMRFVTSYAGIPGVSVLLEEIYKKTVQPEYLVPNELDLPIYVNGSSLTYWDHEGRMPWQTKEFYDRAKVEPGMRARTYRRLHQNEWVPGDDGIEMNDWAKCVKQGVEVGHVVDQSSLSIYRGKELISANRQIQLAGGIDASVNRDFTAVVTVFKENNKLWLGPYRVWKPSKSDPMDLEKTVEAYLCELKQHFNLGYFFYDPYQFERSAQALYQKGIYVQKFPQTPQNQTQSTTHLIDLLKYGNLVMYPDEELEREAIMVAIKETDRGIKLSKETAARKIDAITALSMACEAAASLPDRATFYDQLKVLKLGRRRR